MLQESPAHLGFEFIRDLCVELITLATGVTAVTIAAAERGMLDRVTRRARASIRVGWVLCLVSVGAGILQLMALTGALAPPAGPPAQMPAVPPNARLFGLLQVLTFGLGMISMVAFAWRGLMPKPVPVDAASPAQVQAMKIAPSTPRKPNPKRGKSRR
jgi:hypothetical protein